ncbi:MAG: proline dehydrogenase [Sorangium cellulosum]|nr:MAG: proline dehydrogenase [Sorangium cellulosum]
MARHQSVKSLVTTRGRRFAYRFVAGDDVQDALRAIDALEKEGIHGILDVLGEMASSPEEVEAFTKQILGQIEAFGTRSYNRYVSIKLTQIGLDIDFDHMLDSARQIARSARAKDCFVRIDMEDSPRVQPTIDTFRTLREEGFENVGIVLQSHLRRTDDDLKALLKLSPNVRIVKGAYKEPPSEAFQDKASVDASYRALVRRNLKAGNRTAIATHDERIIGEMQAWIAREGIDTNLVEYQLLYGIRRDLQRKLAAEGHGVRAYVPFGTSWYPYFSRRIAERPENALFVAKAMLKG